MKSFLSISIVALAALSLLSTACAPKDKRFQAKEFVKDGKDTPKGKPVTKPKTGLKVDRTSNAIKIENQNPSGINESEIHLQLHNLEVGDLSAYNQTLLLEARLNLIDVDAQKKGADYKFKLSSYTIGHFNESTKALDLEQTLKIKRSDINKEIKGMKVLNDSAKIKVELVLVQSMTVKDNDNLETSVVAQIKFDLKEITKTLKPITAESNEYSTEPDGDPVTGVKLQASIFSDAPFVVTEGYLKIEEAITCGVKNLKNQELAVELSSVSNTFEIFKDQDGAIVSHEIIINTFDENYKEDALISVSPSNRTEKAIISLTKEECKLDSEDGAYSVAIGLTGENADTLTGCCKKKVPNKIIKEPAPEDAAADTIPAE